MEDFVQRVNLLCLACQLNQISRG